MTTVSETAAAPVGPDLTLGVAAGSLGDGDMLTGHAGDDAVLLARLGEEFFAVGATCTHYGGPLSEGLMVEDTVRCPWHHACFSLRTGAALRPPALTNLPRWRVEVVDGWVFVRERVPSAAPVSAGCRRDPVSVVILGAGAAGNSAAKTLRQEGFEGRITLIDPDPDAPYDRPNLSKDYLAGTAPEEWLPLHPRSYYQDLGIELLSGRSAAAIEVSMRRVLLDDGSTRPFDQLLIATGASPAVLDPATQDGRSIHYLRTLADSRRIIQSAQGARHAVVIGTSFIGLEVASALRTRGVEVHAVGAEALPLGRVLGPELGAFIQRLHEDHGVVFHLGSAARRLDPQGLRLDDGTCLPADLVVAGIGVLPNVDLAENAGIATDRGILVDQYLETSAFGVFAAGDVARWVEPRSGDRVRIEHWVVAQRMGQTAARNMLGRQEPFDAVPFFWSQHYDVPIAYVGYAGKWDEIVLEGDLAAPDAAATYYRNGQALAQATIYRDQQSLTTELTMERALIPANQEG